MKNGVERKTGKITNDEDLRRIVDRDPDLDYQRLYVGIGLDVYFNFSWENKYRMSFSSPIKPEELETATDMGMIKKSDLKDGCYYWGMGRNVRVARWCSLRRRFEYNRSKLGSHFVEVIPHPENEEVETIGQTAVGFDVFIPWYEIEPKGYEVIKGIA